MEMVFSVSQYPGDEKARMLLITDNKGVKYRKHYFTIPYSNAEKRDIWEAVTHYQVTFRSSGTRRVGHFCVEMYKKGGAPDSPSAGGWIFGLDMRGDCL